MPRAPADPAAVRGAAGAPAAKHGMDHRRTSHHESARTDGLHGGADVAAGRGTRGWPKRRVSIANAYSAGTGSATSRRAWWSSAISIYTAGTTNRVNSVPMARPLAITRPILNRETAPAPVAAISGTTSSTIAAVVIRIGRNRM